MRRLVLAVLMLIVMPTMVLAQGEILGFWNFYSDYTAVLFSNGDVFRQTGDEYDGEWHWFHVGNIGISDIQLFTTDRSGSYIQGVILTGSNLVYEVRPTDATAHLLIAIPPYEQVIAFSYQYHRIRYINAQGFVYEDQGQGNWVPRGNIFDSPIPVQDIDWSSIKARY